MENEVNETQKIETVKDTVLMDHSIKKDLNKLIGKYHDGTATEEESNYVEERVNKAREVAKVRLRNDKYVSLPKRIKRFFVRIAIVLIIIAAVFGGFLAKASTVARDNMVVTKTGSKDMLYEFVDQNFGAGLKVDIAKESRRLVVTFPLERSYYLYEYKITVAGKGAYKVTIDSYSELMEYTQYEK